MKKAIILCLSFVAIVTLSYAQLRSNNVIYTYSGLNLKYNSQTQEFNNEASPRKINYRNTMCLLATDSRKHDQYHGSSVSLASCGKGSFLIEQKVAPSIDHDYQYYEDLYNKAFSRRKIGNILTIFGASCGIVGIVLSTRADTDELGTALFMTGGIVINIGIPLWIAGGIKASNNKKAMEELKKQDSLTVGLSAYGIGLAFRF